MSYFPADMPAPEPNMDDQGFWNCCAKQTLCFQACGSCGALRHPPTPICHVCHSVAVTWVKAPAAAEVYTFNVVRHASHPAVNESLPYIGAVVVFPELPSVRLVTNVTGIDPASMAIGMKVELWWDDIGDDMFIPRFAHVTDQPKLNAANQEHQKPGTHLAETGQDNKERGS